MSVHLSACVSAASFLELLVPGTLLVPDTLPRNTSLSKREGWAQHGGSAWASANGSWGSSTFPLAKVMAAAVASLLESSTDFPLRCSTGKAAPPT